MTDEGAVCNRWVSVKKAYSIDNTSCERRICGGAAFWEFPARLRRFQHWKIEAEEFEAGGEELPTEKVRNSPLLNFALAGLPAAHC